jgi:hypothetical protein
VCPKRNDHKRSCSKCAEGFNSIIDLTVAVEVNEQEISSRHTTILQLNKLDEWKHTMEECKKNLLDYRGHLAWHFSESDYATSEMENLADDQAFETWDYNMKTLSC